MGRCQRPFAMILATSWDHNMSATIAFTPIPVDKRECHFTFNDQQWQLIATPTPWPTGRRSTLRRGRHLHLTPVRTGWHSQVYNQICYAGPDCSTFTNPAGPNCRHLHFTLQATPLRLSRLVGTNSRANWARAAGEGRFGHRSLTTDFVMASLSGRELRRPSSLCQY